jgi:low affinity Fe/Cu permease
MEKQASWAEGFHVFAAKASYWVVGTKWAFAFALGAVVLWALTGPHFHFSDTWQLVVNTGTTVITFLVVFLIQNTQNRDAKAIHLKLDEVIRSLRRADNFMIDIENLPDEELEALAVRFEQLRNRHAARKNNKH